MTNLKNVLKKGYREKNSHYCLSIGVKELYINEGELDVTCIDALQKGKVLRESASYHSDWSKEACKELLTDAEKFLNRAGKIIEKK